MHHQYLKYLKWEKDVHESRCSIFFCIYIVKIEIHSEKIMLSNQSYYNHIKCTHYKIL